MEEKHANDIKVKVDKLTKRFGDLLVLDEISFDIKKGEFLCIVGPTGCGKTTFLNLLTKLYEPTSGTIYIDGVPADPKIHNISFVFQEPSAFPWLTAQQNIEYGMKIKKWPHDKIRAQTDKIISLLGLEKFRNAYPHEMSVSMEQRVVIGRAFAMNPDMLLMDEPYGQMDIKMRYYLEDEVIKLWKATNSTVLFITHNLEEAVYLAERVLVLSNKPAKIKAEFNVDLERPRNVAAPEFASIRKEITEMIKWW
ncbi:MAG: ABC transporter ATP-binding protein [Bacillota bacterium]